MSNVGGKEQLKPWLEGILKRKDFVGVHWIDESKSIFCIDWSKNTSNEESWGIFKAWAIHKGRYREGIDKIEYSRWKSTLRTALNKSSQITLVSNKSTDRDKPCRIYKFEKLETKNKCVERIVNIIQDPPNVNSNIPIVVEEFKSFDTEDDLNIPSLDLLNISSLEATQAMSILDPGLNINSQDSPKPMDIATNDFPLINVSFVFLQEEVFTLSTKVGLHLCANSFTDLNISPSDILNFSLDSLEMYMICQLDEFEKLLLPTSLPIHKILDSQWWNNVVHTWNHILNSFKNGFIACVKGDGIYAIALTEYPIYYKASDEIPHRIAYKSSVKIFDIENFEKAEKINIPQPFIDIYFSDDINFNQLVNLRITFMPADVTLQKLSQHDGSSSINEFEKILQENTYSDKFMMDDSEIEKLLANPLFN